MQKLPLGKMQCYRYIYQYSFCFYYKSLEYSIVHKGDIAINGLNLNYDFISQRVASVNTNGIITSAYLTFTPRKIDEQRYLVYLDLFFLF